MSHILTKEELIREVEDINILIWNKKVEVLGIKEVNGKRNLITNEKELRVLWNVKKFLVKLKCDFSEYINFVIKYYSGNKYISFPKISMFNNSKVKLIWKDYIRNNNIEAIRYRFEPKSIPYNGIIFDPNKLLYYGFNTSNLIDDIKGSSVFALVTYYAISPFNKNKDVRVTKEVFYNIELLLASMLRRRDIYYSMIPNIFELWYYLKDKDFIILETDVKKIEKYKGKECEIDMLKEN